MPPKRKIITPNDYSEMGPEYQRRIQEVDPDLMLFHHKVTGWAVFREEADEKGVFYRRIAQQTNPLAKLDIDVLCAGLRARDTHLRGRSHVDQMKEHLADIVKEEEQREARFAEAIREPHEKLSWHVARATGDLTKVVSLAGTDKKKAVD